LESVDKRQTGTIFTTTQKAKDAVHTEQHVASASESPRSFAINFELLSSELRPQDLNRDIVLSHDRIVEALLLPSWAFRVRHKLIS
jgi:hypothetical protein